MVKKGNRPGAKKIKRQIERVEALMNPEAMVHEALTEFTQLVRMFFNYMEIEVDKDFAQFKKRIEHAERVLVQGNDRMQRNMDKFEAKYGNRCED